MFSYMLLTVHICAFVYEEPFLLKLLGVCKKFTETTIVIIYMFLLY
jgi:hypothetical protein